MKVSGIIFDFNRTLYDPDTSQVIEGGLELLEKLTLSGHKLALVCKKSASDRSEVIGSLGLDRFFCKVLIIEGNKKVEHFQDCLLAMQLNSSEVAVVGDRVEEEICIGNRMGMVTVWFKQGKFSLILPTTMEQLPNYVIQSLGDVLNIVS